MGKEEKIPIYLGINDICLQKIVLQVGVDPLSVISGQTLMAACKKQISVTIAVVKTGTIGYDEQPLRLNMIPLNHMTLFMY